MVKKLRDGNKPFPHDVSPVNENIVPKRGVMLIGSNGDPIAVPNEEVMQDEPKRMTRQQFMASRMNGGTFGPSNHSSATEAVKKEASVMNLTNYSFGMASELPE